MTTNNIVYLADRQNGLHLYYPELNERVPAVKMTLGCPETANITA